MDTNERMIDPKIAQECMALIVEGQPVELHIGDCKFFWPVIKKDVYTLLTQGPTNKVTVGIDQTRLYQERNTAMPRMPLPEEAPRRGPGRPPGSRNARGAQAPTEHPSPLGALAGQPRPAQATQLQPAEQVTLAQAEGNEDWVGQALDDAFAALGQQVQIIIEGVVKQAGEAAQTAQVRTAPKTCFDCIHVDKTNNICHKFRVAPPMNIICNAETMCGDFEFDEIPF
jgi:hypothetical protein